MRIVPSPTKPNELGLKLDKEREGDQVVESEGWRKILLIQSNLATKLEGVVFDHQETPRGTGFTLSNPAPGNE